MLNEIPKVVKGDEVQKNLATFSAAPAAAKWCAGLLVIWIASEKLTPVTKQQINSSYQHCPLVPESKYSGARPSTRYGTIVLGTNCHRETKFGG